MAIKFPKLEQTTYMEDGGFMFQWCCSCNLRHIWRFKVHHFKKRVGKKDVPAHYVEVNVVDDRLATKLRRAYLKLIKK